MTKSIKLTREVISRHTEKRATKNIERWLDQHSNELKMVDDVYSLSQVLALMWKDKKNKWAISLMRRLLMKDSLYVGDVINFLQRVKSNNSCKHMQAQVGCAHQLLKVVTFLSKNTLPKKPLILLYREWLI